MKRIARAVSAVSAATAVLSAAACGQAPALDDAARASSPLTAEAPGAVAEVATRYYADADVARTSFATGVILTNQVCSGAMIGPNVFMSAAHCGPRDTSTVGFRAYRGGNYTTFDWELFACTYLVCTYPASDLALYWCAPNARGESPGDRYGYLDFDLSPVNRGDAMYSVWWNPVTSLGLDTAPIYSTGIVGTTSWNDWFAPSPLHATFAWVWGEHGASGSPTLRASTHRIALGPLSTFYPYGAVNARAALTMSDYLSRVSIASSAFDASTCAPLNEARLRGVGLDPATFVGVPDRDGDGVFDVQHAIEALSGENDRSWRWLGFDSARRNALWTASPGSVAFQPDARLARVTSSGGGARVLTHARLNLGAATYRVGLRTNARYADRASALHVMFAVAGVVVYDHPLATPSGGGWIDDAFFVTLPSSGAELRIVATGSVDADVADVIVMKSAAPADFDSHGTRAIWWNAMTGRPGLVLPDGMDDPAYPSDGYVSPRRPNWAGVVAPSGFPTKGVDWPLYSRDLAIPSGGRYVACFKTRRYATGAAAPYGAAVLQIVSGGSVVAFSRFTPGDGWSDVCTDPFNALAGGTATLFGIDVDVAGSSTPGAAPLARPETYLVDALSIIPIALPTSVVTKPGK